MMEDEPASMDRGHQPAKGVSAGGLDMAVAHLHAEQVRSNGRQIFQPCSASSVAVSGLMVKVL